MIRFLRRARSDERGSNAAEIVMLVPTIALLIGVLVAGGRTVHADNSTQSAAMAAARAASLSRDDTAANANAQDAAWRAMNNSDINCTSLNVKVETAGLSAPVGTTGIVSATVTCTVDLSDITLPGIPGARDITSSADSPVDAYRLRN